MNLDNDPVKLFEAELLFRAVAEKVELYIFDNGINYIGIPPFQRLTLSAAKKIQSLVIEFYGDQKAPCCNIIEYNVGGGIDPEAREWVASRSTESSSISDAIVIVSLAQKILSNFYLWVNRPKKPTKFFNELNDAIHWSLNQLKDQKQD